MYEQMGSTASTSNPFTQRDQRQEAESQYAARIMGLSKHFVYDAKDLDVAEIDRAIKASLRIPLVASLEKEHHDLEKLSYLLKGMEAHERADAVHRGAWQAALLRQPGQRPLPPKSPETLTKEEVAQEFESFGFADDVRKTEKLALENYGRLLGMDSDYEIALTKNISINAADVAVLANDLRVRIAERMVDDVERKETLRKLDDELRAIIGSIPEDQKGKRYELQEAYLLRHLVHTADTGHLVSVCHGTPREDLRRGEGSIDSVITAAGQVYSFQVKTYVRNVPRDIKLKQERQIAEARRYLEGTDTKLAVLEAEEVGRSYDSALRQTEEEIISLSDKYRTFRPVLQELDGEDRNQLLFLLGMTEADMRREEEKLQMAWSALEKEREEKKSAEAERTQAAAKEIGMYLEAEEQERREEAERQATAVRRQEEQRLADLAAANQAREEIARRESAKRQMVEENLRLAAERQVTQKAEAERLSAEAAEAERKRLAREEKKKNAGWRPANMSGICNPTLLGALRLLPEGWKGDAQALLAAKKEFFKMFGKPKKGKVVADESDKPNDLFVSAFPSLDCIKSPSEEDVVRWRKLGIIK